MSDVNEGVKIGADVEVKFKVYVDEGAGAYEVEQAYARARILSFSRRS